MPASTITVRLTDEVREKLETIAKSMDRSRSYLIQQAVEDLIRQYDWQLREIEAGIKDAREGKFIEHDALLKYWSAKV
ncbi:MAG: ribbon-helix-helix protein, CopG family [Nitrospiraceae bacterium]|nr:ribbon-helix-helix protein, CopG family [Nitrospiraceae bacterium]